MGQKSLIQKCNISECGGRFCHQMRVVYRTEGEFGNTPCDKNTQSATCCKHFEISLQKKITFSM